MRVVIGVCILESQWVGMGVEVVGRESGWLLALLRISQGNVRNKAQWRLALGPQRGPITRVVNEYRRPGEKKFRFIERELIL